MKKAINIFLLIYLYTNSLSAQKSETEILPKNTFQFNFGIPAMTSGGNLGFYFDTRYLHKFNKRMSIGGMLSFASSGERREGLGTNRRELRTKSTLGNGLVTRKGLALLEENEYGTEHISGSFIFNYDIISKPKNLLSAYIGIGLSHISLHDTPFIVLADVTPVLTGVTERVVLFLPDYARVLDISFPIGINYNHKINDHWFIGTDFGVNIYQKYAGFYYHLAFSVGARF